MATITITPPATLPAGTIVATGVPAERYMTQYAEQFHEWVQGSVIQMSPVSERHDALTAVLRQLVDAYFALNPIGRARSAPFVMRLDSVGTRREPDLQIILDGNPGELADNVMLGPADLCIEIVSPESVSRDYGDKFAEYEQAGVREYWIIDPVRSDARFYRLQATGLYRPAQTDDSGNYSTPLLPRLVLHVPLLWQDELPSVIAIVESVQAMLADGEA